MNLTLSDEQEQLRDVAASVFEKHSSADRVREAETLGFDADLHQRILEVGVPGIGVPESSGGLGGGLLELGLVCEQRGRWLGSAPVIEASVASRAIARSGIDIGRIEAEVLTFCPRPAVRGVAGLVGYGAVADAAVLLDGDRLVLAPHDQDGVAQPDIGCTALADITVDDAAEVLAVGDDAVVRFEQAVDEWRLLTAAALAGLSARALEIGVAYVKERHQFGVPIGSFQAVGHRLADLATDVDGATLLWQKAAWALDEARPEGPALARMAFVFASDVAQRTALASLHYHGGYGFMLEYDIQLFARRAKAWSLAGGRPVTALDHLADALYGAVA